MILNREHVENNPIPLDVLPENLDSLDRRKFVFGVVAAC